MREVIHYWFTGWPDYGVPDSTANFLNFTLEARKLIDQQNSSLAGLQAPVVVHCRFVLLKDFVYHYVVPAALVSAVLACSLEHLLE